MSEPYILIVTGLAASVLAAGWLYLKVFRRVKNPSGNPAPQSGSAGEAERSPLPRSPPLNPGRAAPDQTVVPYGTGAIEAMERRALRQIFDVFGLPMTPGWAFRGLHETRDPVAAFKLFSRWVGVDPVAARGREAGAISRLEVAIHLLWETWSLRDVLAEVGDRRIRDALADTTGPDPLPRLRDQLACVTEVAKLHRIAARLEALFNESPDLLQRCALFSDRLQPLISEIAADPLLTEREDIDEGLLAAERLEVALCTFRTVHAEVRECLTALAAVPLAPEHVHFCDQQTEKFEQLLGALEGNFSVSVAEIEDYVTQAAVIRDSLMMMRGADGPVPHETDAVVEIEEALAALGLSREAGLDWVTIEKRCRELRKKHNTDDPEHCTTPELMSENTERMKDINNAMDVLKRFRHVLTEVMAA